jgi:hypothetical protein
MQFRVRPAITNGPRSWTWFDTRRSIAAGCKSPRREIALRLTAKGEAELTSRRVSVLDAMILVAATTVGFGAVCTCSPE